MVLFFKKNGAKSLEDITLEKDIEDSKEKTEDLDLDQEKGEDTAVDHPREKSNKFLKIIILVAEKIEKDQIEDLEVDLIKNQEVNQIQENPKVDQTEKEANLIKRVIAKARIIHQVKKRTEIDIYDPF